MKPIFLKLCLSLAFLPALAPRFARAAEGDAEALTELRAIDGRMAGNLGVYIKDLASGETIHYRSSRSWYLASVTKIPIAIALLRAVEAGKFTLGHLTALRESDKVDGMGGLQFEKSGTLHDFGDLLEQMITWSDSTAADILVRILGTEYLNREVRAFSGGALGPVTSLLDVRREAFAELHPNARYLPNRAFFALKAAKTNEAKLAVLSAELGKAPKRFATQSVHEAFERYYERGLNSGTLDGLGIVFERLARGEILEKDNAKYLLRIMSKTNTGKERLRAGFPKGTNFAHKTGTQSARICHAGIVLRPDELRAEDGIVVIACAEKFSNPAVAARALREVGKVVTRRFLQPAGNLLGGIPPIEP